MIGTRSLSHPWGPWAGGAAEKFGASDVRAIGKLRRWGDARVHYLVRLGDGADDVCRSCSSIVTWRWRGQSRRMRFCLTCQDTRGIGRGARAGPGALSA